MKIGILGADHLKFRGGGEGARFGQCKSPNYAYTDKQRRQAFPSQKMVQIIVLFSLFSGAAQSFLKIILSPCAPH